MTTRTAALRLQLIDAVSGPARKTAGSLSGVDRALSRLGKGSSPEIRKLTKELGYLERKAGALEEFKGLRRGLKDTSLAMAETRSNAARLEQALKATNNPTARMKNDLDRARVAVRAASSAFREQGAAVRAAEAALKAYGINGRTAISSAQSQIRSDVAKTITEMRKLQREAEKPMPKQMIAAARPARERVSSPLLESATAYAGYQAVNAGRTTLSRSFGNAVSFSQASEFQAALGGYNQKERDALNAQAKDIGGDTRFDNVDVIRAQTSLLQGGIKSADTIMGMMQPITDYALAMGVSLDEAAETVKGAAQTKRVDFQNPKKISEFVDHLVQMAKASGMSDDDVRQYVKYGGASLTGIEMPADYAAAMGIILRRSGIRGDEAGVFARSAASKLVAPTKKGRSALAAMEIDYDSFVKMPDALSLKGLETVIRTEFGKSLTDEMREKVADVLENGTYLDESGEENPIASDLGQFQVALAEILNPLFANDKGKVAMKDANALAKSLGTFHKNSAESVDVVGLFRAIFSKNPSQAQLNSIFTDKQGGRAKNIASQWPQFLEALATMRNVKPGLANEIGTKANQGLYGDWTKLTGTVETALTTVGQDWEFAMRPAINATNSVLDGFNSLDAGSRRLIEAFGGAATIFTAYKSAQATGNLIRGLVGGAAGGTVAGGSTATGGLLGALARSRGNLPMLGYMASVGALAYMFPNTDARKAPAKQYDQGADANKANYRRMWGSKINDAGAWEGGRHRAFSGFGPRPGESSPFGKYTTDAKAAGDQIEENLSVKARPEIDTSSMQSALSLARSIKAAISSLGGLSTTSSSTPVNTNKFGGPRAKGGPVKKDTTYLTGEKGVELFTPGSDGHITPNNQLGARPSGGVTVHVPVQINMQAGGMQDGGALRAFERGLTRAAQTAFSGLKFAGDT